MFEKMKFYAMAINLTTLTWFIAIQYYRFQNSGRACSGDFLAGGIANPLKSKDEMLPKSKEYQYALSFLMINQGFWFATYIFMQYFVYLTCKVWSIILINRLEAEFDEKKALLKDLGHL